MSYSGGLRFSTVDGDVFEDPRFGNTKVRFGKNNGPVSMHRNAREADTIPLASMTE